MQVNLPRQSRWDLLKTVPLVDSGSTVELLWRFQVRQFSMLTE
jgi:hypothetical protein